MTEDEYQDALDKYGEDSFRAGIGAEALREILSNIEPKVFEQYKYNPEEFIRKACNLIRGGK